MLFEKYLVPDLVLNSFREVTPELLTSRGIRFILSDIDNTLVTYGDAVPTPDVLAFFAMLEEHGVKIGFLSNNHAERVELFNRELGYIAVADAGKPGIRKAKEAMEKMGAVPENTMFLGDQLLTDAACAKQLGLFTVIVPPIKDRTDLFNKSKRLIEIPYMRRYRKNQK
ncbi:MAG: YqeG family HAD IIIA-type phosphatase [Ruminococcaceae bacterium]|nr:YqeG family HAD IIIA-type phosphatase [Oscillospiraceae bacterium]